MTDTERYRIERDGDRDLEFTGSLLGEGSHGTGGNSGYSCDWNRGTTVRIYRTEGGHYICAVRQWSQWQGEGELNRASVCSTAEEVLAWLTDDCGGDLGRASKEAWEKAGKVNDGISDLEVEEVA